MIIDFHTHTFPDFLAPKVIPKLEKSACIKAFVDGTMEGLKASMLEAGIDMSVVLPVATSPAQVETCNNSAQKINEEQANKIHSFGAMHPDYADYKVELKRVKEMGLKGIKLHPDYQQTLFDDIRYKRILECATELDLVTVVHAGLDIGLPDPIHATPQIIKNLIDDVYPEKLVLAHMG
ncbi:MAG: amidohydrolase family protein, partial [Eubacteriales bacterium]